MSNQQLVIPLAVGVGIGALVATVSPNPMMGVAAGSLAFAGAYAVVGGLSNAAPQALGTSRDKSDKKKKDKKRQEESESEEEEPKQKRKAPKSTPRSPSPSPESPKPAPKPEKKEVKKPAAPQPPKKTEAPKAAPVPAPAPKKPITSPPASSVPAKSPPAKSPPPKAAPPQPQAQPQKQQQQLQQQQQQEVSKSAQKRAKQKKKEDNERQAKDAELMAAVERKRREDDEKTKQQAALETAILEQKEGWVTQVARKPPKKEKKEKAAKSSDGGEVEPPPPRSRTGKIVVDAKNHGRIIGPKGAILRAIQSVTNTDITMPKLGGGNTIVIEGDPDRIDKAKEIIEDLVKKGFSPDIIQNGETQMAMDLPDEKGIEGRIYGTKGVNLQNIQRKLKVRIAMPERNAKDRRLTLIGTPVQCERARECIQQLIAENFSPITHEGWTKLEFDIPREDLSLLIGKKGTTIQTIQDSTGAKLNIPGEHDMNQHVVVVGPPEAVSKAEKQIMAVLQPDEDEEETAAVDTAWAEGIQEIAF